MVESPPVVALAVHKRSIAIAALSTAIEWYDFTLYLYFSTVLARVFFGPDQSSLLAALAAFAIAYLMRPLGAVVFARMGDRQGRRPMLMLTMAITSAAMLLTALLPTRGEIGPFAAWLFIALRCIIGFSVGGEYTGVVAYLLESAPARRRGFVASLAAGASEIGALLAVAVSAATASAMSAEALDTWGWRVPFFIGAALAGLVWLARSTMVESPDFERLQAEGTLSSNPLREVLVAQRSGIFRAFAISALGSITYYVGITYVPTYLTSVGAIAEARALWISTAAAVAVILVTPVVGLLSDRIGRRPVLLGIAALNVVLPILMFALMASGQPATILAGAVILALLAGAMSAVGAVSTAEQFTSTARVNGLALGATMATALFGGFAPYVTQALVIGTGRPEIPGMLIAAVALGVAPVFWRMAETRPHRLRDERR